MNRFYRLYQTTKREYQNIGSAFLFPVTFFFQLFLANEHRRKWNGKTAKNVHIKKKNTHTLTDIRGTQSLHYSVNWKGNRDDVVKSTIIYVEKSGWTKACRKTESSQLPSSKWAQLREVNNERKLVSESSNRGIYIKNFESVVSTLETVSVVTFRYSDKYNAAAAHTKKNAKWYEWRVAEAMQTKEREKNQNFFLSKITKGTFDLEFIDSFSNCRLSNNGTIARRRRKKKEY